MRRALLLILLAGMPACSESGNAATSGPADANPDALVVSLSLVGDAGARYPYDPSTDSHRMYVRYESRVQNYTKDDLQDVKLQVPRPEAFARNASIKVEGGSYNGLLAQGEQYIDWLPGLSGAVRSRITMERNLNLFADDGSFSRGEQLRGETTIAVTARATQYDTVLATSAPVEVTYYLPNKVAPQPFDFYSGQWDGNHLYLSGRTRNTPADAGVDDNRAGVYRVDPTSGATETLALIQGRNDPLPFWVAEKHVYFANWTNASGQERPALYRLDKSAFKGSPELVPLPDGVTEILGMRSNASHVYVTLRTNNGPYFIYRFSAANPTSEIAKSANIGRPIPDTLAITSSSVVALLEDPPSMLRLPLDLSSVTKMTDTSSSAGRRTLACSEASCFWVQWTNSGMYEIALSATAGTDAGAPIVKKISGTNQPFLYDGTHLYSGINGLIRVGPGGNPAEERLFNGGLPPMLGSDANYIYFGYDSFVWKLHK